MREKVLYVQGESGRRPADLEELVDATRAAVLRGIEDLAAEELGGARTALHGLAETLEARLLEPASGMRALARLATELGGAESLAQVAHVAARAACQTLAGRRVEVELDAVRGPAGPVRAVIGAEIAEEAGEPLLELPVASCGERLGWLRAGAAAEEAPPPETGLADASFLECVAAMSGAAAAALLRRLERDQAWLAAILGLARLANRRDGETGRHLERVGRYAREIALALRERERFRDVVDARFVEDVERAAPLHDIGKVGIPDRILQKPGPLTEDEWEEMRKHPAIGAETLRPLVEGNATRSDLAMGLDVAWAHHERWDGGGYPRGLAGEAIPLAARIVAVADCYDALTSRRPYKAPWSHAEAARYVREEAGTRFDPDVAAAFLERVDAIDEIRRRLADGEPASE